MKPGDILKHRIAQQSTVQAAPEELRGVIDDLPIDEDEARAILAMREEDGAVEEAAASVADATAGVARLLEADPRQILDLAVGMLDGAMTDPETGGTDSPSQEARSGGVGGELEQQARDWAADILGGGGSDAEISEDSLREWADGVSPNSAPLPDPDEADTAGPFRRKRWKPTETQREGADEYN